MTQKQVEQTLASAFGSLTPKTTFEDLSEKLRSAPERRRVIMTTVETKKKNPIIRFVAPAVAACLLLAVGVTGGVYYSEHLAVDSVIDIDVNPGIELTTNKQNRVLEAVAINEDGADVLDGMDLSKTDLQVAINAIIGSMVRQGYVANENGGILVTVQNGDTAKARTLRNEVLTDINATLKQYEVEAPVLNQTATDIESVKAFAEENGISVGKALFVQNLSEKDPTLDPKALAKQSIRQLADLIIEKKLDIRDIVDYDAEDSIWENIADTIEDANEDANENVNQGEQKPSTSKPQQKLLTAAEAKAAALNLAGYTESQATFIKVELDKDDGIYHYDVEFVVGNKEFEYEIQASTGAVLDEDVEIEDDYPTTQKTTQKATTAKPTSKRTTVKPTATAKKITAAKAESLALAHAGVKKADAVFERTEFDVDDGVAYYEVEFRVGRVEYSYEIHAFTGKVLEADKDLDD